MPNKKLTDKEIVKALECCSEPIGINCVKCPLEKDCLDVNMCEIALDLINRLQEEKEALINGQETLQKYIADLQAENERLKPFEDKIAGFNSHIRVEDMLVFASSLEEWLEFCDNLKAEAYKEFAERLNSLIMWSPKNHISITVKDIDNLLKEMVGDSGETLL